MKNLFTKIAPVMLLTLSSMPLLSMEGWLKEIAWQQYAQNKAYLNPFAVSAACHIVPTLPGMQTVLARTPHLDTARKVVKYSSMAYGAYQFMLARDASIKQQIAELHAALESNAQQAHAARTQIAQDAHAARTQIAHEAQANLLDTEQRLNNNADTRELNAHNQRLMLANQTEQNLESTKQLLFVEHNRTNLALQATNQELFAQHAQTQKVLEEAKQQILAKQHLLQQEQKRFQTQQATLAYTIKLLLQHQRVVQGNLQKIELGQSALQLGVTGLQDNFQKIEYGQSTLQSSIASTPRETVTLLMQMIGQPRITAGPAQQQIQSMPDSSAAKNLTEKKG